MGSRPPSDEGQDGPPYEIIGTHPKILRVGNARGTQPTRQVSKGEVNEFLFFNNILVLTKRSDF